MKMEEHKNEVVTPDVEYEGNVTCDVIEVLVDGNISLIGCKYGWLYDRTSNNCEAYGCLNNSAASGAYYTVSVTKICNDDAFRDAVVVHQNGGASCSPP